MKTYDQVNDTFINEYAELIDEYNSVTGTILEDDLKELYSTLIVKKPKLTPTSFFREVKSVLKNAQGSFEDIDIINFLTCLYDDGNKTHSLLQSYFDDIKLVYDNLPEEELEYCPENRDALIKSNLKMVISTAKRYRDKGLSFEDLIGAGNEGLCTAWDKYKPERNVLRDKIISELEAAPEELSKDYIDYILSPFVKYGSLKKKYDKFFEENIVYKRDVVIKWIHKNIKKAKFSSVAQLWIRAYILQEIDNKSRVVKKPKADIDKDLKKYGCYLKETLVPIDPLSDYDDKGNLQTHVELSEYDNTEDDIDRTSDMISFKYQLNQLVEGINNRDRRILFKSFGIGLPRSMEPKEIAEAEDLSVARVSQIIQDCITKMKKNAADKGIKNFLHYLR